MIKKTDTAGSGKSLMLAKIALNLRQKLIESGSKKKILVIAYNKTLVKGTKELFEKNNVFPDDSYITVSTIDSLLGKICYDVGIIPRDEQSRSQFAQQTGGYGSRNKNNHSRKTNVSDEERVLYVREVLSDCRIKCKPHAFYNYDPEFWAEEIQWMYSNGIIDADDKETYLEIDRNGRCKNYNTRMRKSSREIAFDIFNRYNRLLMDKGKFEWERLYALLLRSNIDKIPSSAYYDYVFIDEAQDFSLIKLMLATSLCRYSVDDEAHLYMAMDKNQSLYGHRWSFRKHIGIETHVKKLSVVHRNTMEIDLLARDLKKVDDTILDAEDIYENEMSTISSGVLPQVVRCADNESQIVFILNYLRNLDLERRTVAIILPDYNNMSYISTRLKRAGIESSVYHDDCYSPFSPGVKLTTVHSSKGLGFNNVLIPYFEEGIYPKSAESIIRILEKSNSSDLEESVDIDDAVAEEVCNSRRLAYVAITRAKNDLTIMYSGNPSRFISEFDESHYVLMDEGYNRILDESIIRNANTYRSRPRLGSFNDSRSDQKQIGLVDEVSTSSNDGLMIREKNISEYDSVEPSKLT